MSDMVEAVVVEFGLQLVVCHRFTKVLMQSANLMAWQGLHDVDNNIMELGIICKNIRGLLPMFDTCVWNHGYRKVNEVSHIMVHSIANCNTPIVIMDIPPTF